MADNKALLDATAVSFTMRFKDVGGINYPVHLFAKQDGTLVDPLGPGSAADAASLSVAFSTEGKLILGSITETMPTTAIASSGLNGRLQYIGSKLTDIAAGEYETVAASVATAQTIGATGATGDWLEGLLITPSTVNPGAVTLFDNATQIWQFAGGTASVSNLVPFYVPFRIKSLTGAWKITTGAAVTVVATGNFL